MIDARVDVDCLFMKYTEKRYAFSTRSIMSLYQVPRIGEHVRYGSHRLKVEVVEYHDEGQIHIKLEDLVFYNFDEALEWEESNFGGKIEVHGHCGSYSEEMDLLNAKA